MGQTQPSCMQVAGTSQAQYRHNGGSPLAGASSDLIAIAEVWDHLSITIREQILALVFHEQVDVSGQAQQGSHDSTERFSE